jgi:molybdate transport system substrate-binding protein
MMKIIILFFLVLTLLLAGYASQPTATQTVTEMPASAISEPTVLKVFAAASLTEPFGEIGKVFETNHPGVTAVFNFAGSQQLAQQINEGAPADVFASANKTQMDAVNKEKRAHFLL